MAASIEAWEAWEMLTENPDETLSDPAKIAFCCQHLLYIKDRNGKVVSLILNNTQLMIVKAYCEMRRQGVPVRIICLKGRQQGSSTLCCALVLLEMLAYGNRSTLAATEEKGGSAKNMFNKYKDFLDRFPLLPEGKDMRYLCDQVTDGQRFQLDNGSYLRTEGEKEIISYTTHSVHISEAAFFTDFSTYFPPLMAGVPHFPNTTVFIESTAKQYGDGFFDHWSRAENGLSNFMAVFAAWFVHEENVMPVPDDPDAYAKFKQSIGQMQKVYGDEIALQQQFNLSDEQLMFRRYRIDNECDGSIGEFQRQYPSTAQEAFLAAERPVFDPASISFRLEQTKPHEFIGEMRPDKRYTKYDGTERAEWVDTPNGAIELWDKPQNFEEYVIGSDHAEGLPGGDFNACLIFKRWGFQQVGKIHGTEATRLDAVEYAKQLFYTGRWFNDAHVLLEANHQSGGVVAGLMQEWEYPNLIFEHQVFPKENNEQPMNPRIGWLSNKGRRKDGVDFMVDALALDFKVEPPKPKSEWNPIIYDHELIEQCIHFVWKTNGRAEAKRKNQDRNPNSSAVGHHDDLIFAFISTILAHRALPIAQPREQTMIEALGPNHPMVRDLPEDTLALYAPKKEEFRPNSWQDYI